MQDLTFEVFQADTTKNPEKIVIFLHGLGSDGKDLIALAPYFSDLLPNAIFYSPNAPFPCDMAPYGYQWFSLQDRNPQKMLQGAEIAAPILNHFIDEKLKIHGLQDSDLFLIGFSQGTMMSLYTAPRRAVPCAGVVGFSGALIGGETLKTDMKSNPPICLVHGEYDDVVPFAAMEAASNQLTAAGLNVVTQSCPFLGHSIDQMGLQAARGFVQNCLQKRF